MTTLTDTDTAEMTIRVTVWDDPLAAGGLEADSDDALVAGAVRVFGLRECRVRLEETIAVDLAVLGEFAPRVAVSTPGR